MLWQLSHSYLRTTVSLSFHLSLFLWCFHVMMEVPAWSPKAFRLDQASFGSANRDTHGHMRPHRSVQKHIGWEREQHKLCYVMSTLAPWACGSEKRALAILLKTSIYEAKHITQWTRALIWHENCLTLQCPALLRGHLRLTERVGRSWHKKWKVVIEITKVRVPTVKFVCIVRNFGWFSS